MLGHNVYEFSILGDNALSGCFNYLPIHSHWSVSSPTLSIFSFLNCSHPNICVTVSLYALNVHSFDYSLAWISFIRFFKLFGYLLL